MAAGMKSSFSRLKNWWRSIRRRNRISGVKHIRSMDDLPRRLGAALFVVERAGMPRWAVLDCPCLCGARIEVNLMTSRQPHWTLKQEGSRVSISPSLWQPERLCGSHFFIVRNRIQWVS